MIGSSNGKILQSLDKMDDMPIDLRKPELIQVEEEKQESELEQEPQVRQKD